MNLHLPVLERLVAEVRAGRPVAICAVVRTTGSVPQVPGALMLIDQGMNTTGTLGGGCVEAEVRKRAFELLSAGTSQILDFDLDDISGWDDGLICGGAMGIAVVPLSTDDDLAQFERAAEQLRRGLAATLALDIHQPEHPTRYEVRIEHTPTLLIAGAGHIGTELAHLCTGLEFRVVVVDDRADFANRERLPAPIEPITADIEKTLREFEINPSVYVVIVTRGHRHDEQALAAVVNSEAAYVGMIGSRRKVGLIREHLLESGVNPKSLDRVHAPIGLSIGAITVPEIAVSIAAQLVEVRRANRLPAVVGPTPLG